MRPRTFAREIAFQILYQDDLNPSAAAPVVGDALLEQGRFTRELTEFVRHLSDLHEQEDAGPQGDETLYAQWLRTPALVEFTRGLIVGVRQRRGELDDRITQAARNWSVDRMAATDRNLLRLGAYEVLFTDTPPKVSVDEAVELAKRFGGAQSAQFVNGILDNVMHQGKNDEARMTNDEGNPNVK